MNYVNHPACGRQVDSSLRRAATGLLGGLFQTPPTTCIHAGVPSRRIQDFLFINDDGDSSARLK